MLVLVWNVTFDSMQLEISYKSFNFNANCIAAAAERQLAVAADVCDPFLADYTGHTVVIALPKWAERDSIRRQHAVCRDWMD